MLAVGAGGGCLAIFSLNHHFSLLSPSLWEAACSKGRKTKKQPTNDKKTENKLLQTLHDMLLLKNTNTI